MIPDQTRNLDSRDVVRALREQGLLQPQRHVRDRKEIFTALLDAILNDTAYVSKVQHLIELYGAAYPHLKPETRKKVDLAFRGVRDETPTPSTTVGEHGTQGSMLIVEQSKAEGNTSALPLDHPDFYRIFMGGETENAHIRMYLKLTQEGVLGLVINDLVDARLLPAEFASDLREMDTSEEEKVVAGN